MQQTILRACRFPRLRWQRFELRKETLLRPPRRILKMALKAFAGQLGALHKKDHAAAGEESE